MKNTGKEYEKLTQLIFSQIVNQNDAINIDVQHDVVLQGKTTTHQIDVFWKFELGNVEYLTVIQAKDWRSKVKKSDMLSFKATIDDLPTGTKGIFVALNGFQSGAIEVAKAHGIMACELRPPKDDDWKGYIQIVGLHIQMRTPRYEHLVITLDKKWADEKGVSLPPIGEPFRCSDGGVIYDSSSNAYWSLSELITLLADRSIEGMQPQEYVFTKESFIFINGVYVKVDRISGNFGYSVHDIHHKIDAKDFVGYVLKNVISGESEMFDKEKVLKKQKRIDSQ